MITAMSISSKPYYILGISCFYHDSAAALIKDGQLIAAAQEERFTRKKHDERFPVEAIQYCLKEADVNVDNLSAIIFYEKPILKFERLLVSFIKSWPFEYKIFLKAISAWLREKLWIKPIIRQKLDYGGPIYFTEHHIAHAASSFFASPFNRAAILTVDGVGEWATATFGKGKDNQIELLQEIRYPDSLGLLYSAITYFLGFKPNSDEYKVMGLAPYGQSVYRENLNQIFKIFSDGSFSINRKIFGGNYIPSLIAKKLEEILGFPKKEPETVLTQQHKDLAASLQELTNETMIKLAKHVRETTGENNLCLAGGVTLNCVSNSEIFYKAGFKNIFIQPAAGDAGGALGAAYFFWHQIQKQPRSFEMTHCFWGPSFRNEEIKNFLDSKNVVYRYLESDLLVKEIAELIQKQNVVGWFQGRMEWGPRALGHRSILADARNKNNWQKVNLKIKFRESFRPFAPAVLHEKSEKYFDWPIDSPFMLFTSKVKSRDIPAVIHVDNSARLQTVDLQTNPLFYQLLKSFENLTGCPVLINTSFNIRDEPIVCTLENAWNTFLKTELDFLVLGNYIIDRQNIKK